MDDKREMLFIVGENRTELREEFEIIIALSGEEVFGKRFI